MVEADAWWSSPLFVTVPFSLKKGRAKYPDANHRTWLKFTSDVLQWRLNARNLPANEHIEVEHEDDAEPARSRHPKTRHLPADSSVEAEQVEVCRSR
ncbi:hypothetical protein ACEPAG_4341 [Sanghuangporus baumii]